MSAVVLASCAKFGSDADLPPAVVPDAAADGGVALDGEAGVASVIVRCGDIACNTPSKCCLPFFEGDAGCARSDAVCGADVGELLCSDPSACRAGEICCLNAARNRGQTAFLIASTFCAPTSSCPDGPLQRVACRLGASDQCPAGTACKPYLRDTNGAQNLDVETLGYATCQ